MEENILEIDFLHGDVNTMLEIFQKLKEEGKGDWDVYLKDHSNFVIEVDNRGMIVTLRR